MANVLAWNVKRYNCNSNKIEDYDVLKYEELYIRKLKKKSNNKEEFAEELRSHLKYHYWSRCEWELVIRKKGDSIFLLPWCGCRYPEEVAVEVTKDTSFPWFGFADKYVVPQIFTNGALEAKIDVWDQVEYRWDEFVDYCWNTRLRYERHNRKQGENQ